MERAISSTPPTETAIAAMPTIRIVQMSRVTGARNSLVGMVATTIQRITDAPMLTGTPIVSTCPPPAIVRVSWKSFPAATSSTSAGSSSANGRPISDRSRAATVDPLVVQSVSVPVSYSDAVPTIVARSFSVRSTPAMPMNFPSRRMGTTSDVISTPRPRTVATYGSMSASLPVYFGTQ